MATFDDAALQRQAEQALNEILPGKRGALVAVAGLDGHVEGRLAFKVGDAWTLGAVVRRWPGEKPEGGVRVMWSW